MNSQASMTRHSLEERAEKVGSEANQLVGSLPDSIKPGENPGFGVSQIVDDTEVELSGWNYDWSDKGDDPPPWSDWPDKEE